MLLLRSLIGGVSDTFSGVFTPVYTAQSVVIGNKSALALHLCVDGEDFYNPPAFGARFFFQGGRAAYACRARAFVKQNSHCYPSNILPSVEIVTTCHGIILLLFCRAVTTAFSMPPQHGTSMRTTVTDLMLFRPIISVSFSP